MPQTREMVARYEEEARQQHEAAQRLEQQRREAEQRRIAGARVASNPSKGSSRPTRAAAMAKKPSKASVADVDVEMSSEVGSADTARTVHTSKVKVKEEMPDSDNPPEGAIEVRRIVLYCCSIR